LTNPSNESELHRIFGNQDHLEAAYNSIARSSSFKGEVYTNFTIHTNPRERTFLKTLVSHHPNFIVEDSDMSDLGRIRFLGRLRSSDFVLCPEGNGVDTHRLWETLYMGGFPIIRRNPAITSLVRDLPVLEIDSWKQVFNLDFLEETWNRFTDEAWEFDKLRCSYWLAQIDGGQTERES